MTMLGDVCTVRSSLVDPTRPEFARLPHVAPDSIEKGSGRLLAYRTASEDGVTSGKYRFEAGDVLYSKIRPNLNKVALVDFVGVCSADMYALDVDRNLASPAYVAYALRSQGFLGYATSLSNRANIPKLNREQLLRFDLRLPPLPEQRRIAAILDHADTLRAKRCQVLTHLDALIQAMFHDMFGTSTSGRVPIGSFADVRSGSTPSRKDPDNFGGSIPWVKTTEVQGTTILTTSESVTEKGVKSARLKTFPIGSVVVAMYGQGKTRGQSAILGIPAATNQACAVVAPNDSFDPAFLQAQLAISYDRLRGEAEGGNQPNLSIGRVSGFEVLLPSIDLQREFTSRVDRISAHRASVENATISDGELFASLQSRAFRGEL